MPIILPKLNFSPLIFIILAVITHINYHIFSNISRAYYQRIVFLLFSFYNAHYDCNKKRAKVLFFPQNHLLFVLEFLLRTSLPRFRQFCKSLRHSSDLK